MSNDINRKTLSLKREATPAQPAIEERLHKVLAQAGLGSRRALEERIARGDIRVNGEIAEVGRVIKGGDRVELDGKTFMATALTEPPAVLLFNKPEGVVTTRDDPEGRPTIFETLPRLKGARWIAVGRLDINTTGLLLLTTDGDLANALMHPSSEVEREYVCRIHGEVPDAVVERLKRGVPLEDGTAKFDDIEAIGNSESHAWFRVVIKEGRNREVRRLWESQGFQVSRLKRVRYGHTVLPRELLRGHSTEMEAAQVEALRRSLKLPDQAPVLTLQPVIGQRRASKQTINVRRDQRGPSYVNGALDQEERELRRFDHVREERPAGRGRGKPGGGAGRPYVKRAGKPFVGPMGSDAPAESRGPRPAGKPFGAKKPYAKRVDGAPGSKPVGDRAAGGGGKSPWGDRPAKPSTSKPYAGKPRGPRAATGGVDNASGAFRSWYVPEGVDTGSKVAPPRKDRSVPFGKPGGDPAARGPRGEGGPARGPRGPGGPGSPSGPGGSRGPRGPGGPGGGGGGGRGPSGGNRGPGAGSRGPGGNAGSDKGPRGPGGGAPRGGQRKPGPRGHGPRLPEGAPDID